MQKLLVFLQDFANPFVFSPPFRGYSVQTLRDLPSQGLCTSLMQPLFHRGPMEPYCTPPFRRSYAQPSYNLLLCMAVLAYLHYLA